MDIFKSTSLFKFQEKFKTNEDCKEYLYHFKWKDGFECSCGHTEAWDGNKPYTKVCKKCRKIHSSTSGTIFHNIKFDLKKAFYIVFEMATTTKSVSCLQIASKYDLAKNTAWLFMRKYRQSLKSSEKYPINNDGGNSVIYVDEFVVGGYEQGKTGRTNNTKKRKILMVVEATSKNKIKRVYGIKIQNYSGEELKKIFDKFIEKGSTVITDGWRGYNRMNNDYNMISDVNKMKQNNNPMNRMIQQYKSWIRGIYHKSTHQHIEAYLNEFCFRINRSQWKDTRFHSAILKGLSHEPYQKNMIPDVNCYV